MKEKQVNELESKEVIYSESLENFKLSRDIAAISGYEDVVPELLQFFNQWDVHPDNHYSGIAALEVQNTVRKSNKEGTCVFFLSSSHFASCIQDALMSFPDPVQWRVFIGDRLHYISTPLQYSKEQLLVSQKNLVYHLKKTFVPPKSDAGWRSYVRSDEPCRMGIRDCCSLFSGFDVMCDLFNYLITADKSMSEGDLRVLLEQKYGVHPLIGFAFEESSRLNLIKKEGGFILLVSEMKIPRAELWKSVKKRNLVSV